MWRFILPSGTDWLVIMNEQVSYLYLTLSLLKKIFTQNMGAVANIRWIKNLKVFGEKSFMLIFFIKKMIENW